MYQRFGTQTMDQKKLSSMLFCVGTKRWGVY